jgi:FkbM family methyltransferase
MNGAAATPGSVTRIPGVPETNVGVLAARLDPPVTILDVGVRGGIEDVWTSRLEQLRVFGFDADEGECAKLADRFPSPRLRFVPLALGATVGPATLYRTEDPACASLYPPDDDTAALYPALSVTRLAGTSPVGLATLDAWADEEGVTDVSYIKLDAQGAELDILRGAVRLLERVWALRVEVEFNPIYREQPLFGDVDAFLRQQGFVVWRLSNLCHYLLAGQDTRDRPVDDRQVFAASVDDATTVEFAAPRGRVFWGDALFVRRQLADGLPPADPDAATRAACVLSALELHELAAVCR